MIAAMNLLEELFAAQHEHGQLDDDVLRALSGRLRVPLYHLEALRSFYPHFRKTRAPAVSVEACRDLACHLKGAPEVCSRLERIAAQGEGAEINAVSCLGLCERAPAVRVNEVPVSAEAAVACIERGSAPPVSEAEAPLASELDVGEPYSELARFAASPDAAASIERLSRSGLRGMGGAGFPTGRKWELVRDQPGPRYVICNADESEPGTFKDRIVLEQLPHRVVEGMVLAGLCVGAEEGIVYIRHEYVQARERLERAIADARERGALGRNVLGSGRAFDVRVFVSPGGYVLGDETALLEALEARRGEPRNKPPYPGVSGLNGRPTLINNVETLAQVPYALRHGRADRKLFSVCGDVEHPGVHEVPLGTTLRELVERCGGVAGGRELAAFLPGGASTRLLPGSQADVAMDWDGLERAGSSLGTGAVLVLAEGRNLLDCARNLTAFFRNESCGKCVPCRIGTQKAVALIDDGTPAALGRLPELHELLRDTSICGLGQAALHPVTSLLEHFPELLEEGAA